MKKVYRQQFPDGKESVSDSRTTVLIVNKQKPGKVIEDSIYEEHYNKFGIKAVKDRDIERQKEKGKKTPT